MKMFYAEFGLPLDASFDIHRGKCSRCSAGDIKEFCLEGAVLWKKENVVKPVKAEAEKDPHRTSVAKAKSLMRYK